jgi:hypothetical protein
MSDGAIVPRNDRIEELEAEVQTLRSALEWACGGDSGYEFNETWDGLVHRGLLVEVPASDEYRSEWESDTMWVWRWQAGEER